MKVPRIKKLPKHIQREIDTRLIESGFSGYEMLATELQHRGCRISTSALHRYGQTLEKQIQDARAREIAIEAGIGEAIAADTGAGRTTVIILDRFNGRGRMIQTDALMPDVIAQIKRMGEA
jgi:hypothetical protein